MPVRMFTFGLLLIACGALVFAQERGTVSFDDSALPRNAAAIEKFVPSGWTVEKQISGDLNNDGVPDVALELIEKLPANLDKDNPPSRERALVILFKNRDGSFERRASAKNLLQCTGCGGAFYGLMEAPADVEIAKGILIIGQESGSREVSETTFRFRYDAAVKRFALIGYDETTRDRATGGTTTESSNYLTGVKITRTFQYNKKLDREVKKNVRQTEISRLPQYLEQTNYETFGVK